MAEPVVMHLCATKESMPVPLWPEDRGRSAASLHQTSPAAAVPLAHAAAAKLQSDLNAVSSGMVLQCSPASIRSALLSKSNHSGSSCDCHLHATPEITNAAHNPLNARICTSIAVCRTEADMLDCSWLKACPVIS